MSSDLPPPLVPSDVDLRDFPFTPLFRARLFGSSFHARSSDAQWRAGVTLWLKSWDQVPAGTLPDDEIDLCRLAELGRDIKTWRKVATGALHGWVKCSDGRLHHPVVAEGVLEAWDGKSKQSRRGAAGAKERWRKHREAIAQASKTDGASMQAGMAQASSTDSTSTAQAMLGDGNRQGKGEGEGDSRKIPTSSGGDPPPLEAQVYRQGKRILGKSAGGQITLLRKAVGNDVEVLALLEEAERKGDPTEWIAGVIKRRGEPQTDSLGLPLTPISELGKSTDDLYRKLGVN